MKITLTTLSLLIIVFFTCCKGKNQLNQNSAESSDSVAIQATIITEATLNDTDDPAIWINFSDPSKSLILGTDKGETTGGIYVFNLEGKIDSSLSVFNLLRPNNIDIEYGFRNGENFNDIAVFTERGRNCIRVFSLPDMKEIDNGGIEVFVGDSLRDPMGISLFKEPVSGNIYAIVSRKTGPSGSYLWQYLLEPNSKGDVTGKLVRKFGTFSGLKEIEAIAVDDALGHVYYSDENFGIRQYYAHPDSSNNELALFGTSGFSDDQEGISIYPTGEKTGYIIVSDQGANKFHIFNRQSTNENTFDHSLLKIVKVDAMESDGSEVVATPINDTFKHGLFIAMSNNKTFHFYKWENIARKKLVINK